MPKISGFTFVRNASRLYIPAKQAIASVLPLVDEFVVALGKGDDDDLTEQWILELNDPKIRILHTDWDIPSFPKNTVYARETDKAKEACRGDWLFYIQCDEAIHEQYLPIVKEAIERYHQDPEVEGLLFHYKHFWGDYEHFNSSHAFYNREIRVIRNHPKIHSWRDAQSFRYFETFDHTAEDYLRKEGTRKLKVAQIPAYIYHYGWVRPPHTMQRKSRKMNESYHGKERSDQMIKKDPDAFDYGPLDRFPRFKGTHPSVMKDWVDQFDWEDELYYQGKFPKRVNTPKHEKRKVRILTWIEQNILKGKQIGEFKNFIVTRQFR
ncbi:MAG: hypothetical protein LPK80_11445 [Bacteroidota bacterium]|nr:hypothetical protein [Bacteroidota bacterium]MDX5447712.1 hypothetical protein [Bacteroidota bacterium]